MYRTPYAPVSPCHNDLDAGGVAACEAGEAGQDGGAGGGDVAAETAGDAAGLDLKQARALAQTQRDVQLLQPGGVGVQQARRRRADDIPPRRACLAVPVAGEGVGVVMSSMGVPPCGWFVGGLVGCGAGLGEGPLSQLR